MDVVNAVLKLVQAQEEVFISCITSVITDATVLITDDLTRVFNF